MFLVVLDGDVAGWDDVEEEEERIGWAEKMAREKEWKVVLQEGIHQKPQLEAFETGKRSNGK